MAKFVAACIADGMSVQLAELFRVQFATMGSQGDDLAALKAAVNG